MVDSTIISEAPKADVWVDPDLPEGDTKPDVDVQEVDKGIDIPDSQESHDNWEPSEAEAQAMKGGWRPQSEWDGDPEEWVSAREFNFRGELMDRIRDLGRKVGQLESDKDKLNKMVAKSDLITQKMVEDAYNRAMRNLKEQRREASRDGDYDAVDEIEEAMSELRETHDNMEKEDKASKAPAPQAQPSPVQRAWYDFVTNTKWVQDPKIFTPLLQFAEGQLNENPNMEVGDFMESVLDKSKDLRGTGRRGPAGPDDSKGSSYGRQGGNRRSGRYSASDLNEQQRFIAKQFEEDGISLDEYANMLGKEGALDKQRG